MDSAMFVLWITVTIICPAITSADDPCFYYKRFPSPNLGSRNENCSIDPTVPTHGDVNLQAAWYNPGKATILTHCPVSGNCSMWNAVWMRGQLPDEKDGIVDRQVCVKHNGDCCPDAANIKVKRCQGYLVYKLNATEFSTGYCFESTEPCVTKRKPPTKSPDPCVTHRQFPVEKFGSRKEMCEEQEEPVCDFSLAEGWYATDHGQMLNHCPTNGSCGSRFAAWLNGPFPNESDGVVTRQLCIMHSRANCCGQSTNVTVKRCPGYYVYHLKSFDLCPTSFCFESRLPCQEERTSEKGKSKVTGKGQI